MANLKYWLWLTERKGLAGQVMWQVLEHFGSPESAYFADEEEYRLLTGLGEGAIRSLKDKSLSGADRILGDCDRLGIRVMTIQDAIYPERLRAIHQPPAVLYWKGREVAFDEEAAVAIVGTRDATPYGIRMAGQLSLDLTRAGALIVSGIAQGIDATAVRSALKAGGPVVSVLGNGIDVIYPKYHRDLYEDIAAAGTLISECPPGTGPKGSYFPVRNRLISGLSAGVIVVESRRVGGSLWTAGHALEQDREVFAVPGPADGVDSEGTNRLIQEGAAKLVMNADDVICELIDRFPQKLTYRNKIRGEARQQRLESCGETQPAAAQAGEKETVEKTVERAEEKETIQFSTEKYISLQEFEERFTDDQRKVFLALEKKPLTADDLVEETQVPARRVLAALTILQIQGLVGEESGKRFRTAVRLKME